MAKVTDDYKEKFQKLSKYMLLGSESSSTSVSETSSSCVCGRTVRSGPVLATFPLPGLLVDDDGLGAQTFDGGAVLVEKHLHICCWRLQWRAKTCSATSYQSSMRMWPEAMFMQSCMSRHGDHATHKTCSPFTRVCVRQISARQGLGPPAGH